MRLSPIKLWVLLWVGVYGQNPFNRAVFQCERMPLSLCCTTRLRQTCPSQCSDIRCVGDSFYRQVIERQVSRFTPRPRPPPIPPRAIPTDISLSIDQTTDELEGGFPPFRPRGLATFQNGKNDGEARVSKGPPLAQTPFPVNIVVGPEPNTTPIPDYGMVPLKPPIGETGEWLEPLGEDPDPIPVPQVIQPSLPPNSFISSSAVLQPKGAVPPAGSGMFSINVQPHQASETDFGEDWKNINFWRKTDTATGSGNTDKVTLEKGISKVIEAFLNSNALRNHTNTSTHAIAPPRTTMIPPPPPPISTTEPTLEPVISTTLSITQPECGVAPSYKPCVSIKEANSRMLECCRHKLIPPGCHQLCRYDVTQPQIKATMDAGQCGILHVAPIVECASGGNDNIDCCRHREVATKSGPQCEVFCRGGQGIKGLGLQHLVCNNVMNDLILCHHAGLRP